LTRWGGLPEARNKNLVEISAMSCHGRESVKDWRQKSAGPLTAQKRGGEKQRREEEKSGEKNGERLQQQDCYVPGGRRVSGRRKAGVLAQGKSPIPYYLEKKVQKEQVQPKVTREKRTTRSVPILEELVEKGPRCSHVYSYL